LTRHSPRRLLVAAAALVVVAAPLIPTQASADRFNQEIAALQAQANALTHQIASLNHQTSSALGQVLSLQQGLDTTQNQLGSAAQQLDSVNKQLAITTRNQEVAQGVLASDQQQLSRLLVAMYESGGTASATAALVDSGSFVDAIDTLTSLGQVSDRMQTLVTDVHTKQRQLVTLAGQQRREQTQANTVVSTLQTLAARQSTEETAYNLEAHSLSGRAAVLVRELHSVRNRIAEVKAEQAAAEAAAGSGPVRVVGGALRPFAFGPLPDHFPWGQCTWYVASLRNVTWNGNAWQWAATAADAGRPEGMTPRVGSIVVFGPGGGYSFDGHVAYVVAVHGSHTFTIDEGNYLGLGVVDQRTVYSLNDVEAFIY